VICNILIDAGDNPPSAITLTVVDNQLVLIQKHER